VEDRAERLAGELAALQRGRALQSPDLDRVVGPLLTQALALEQLPEGEPRREALIAGLIKHAESLPPDLRHVFLVACSARTKLPPALGERLETVADRISVNVRTVQRRKVAANQRIAERLVAAMDAGTAQPPAEWVLTELRASTDLTAPRPIFRSTHSIRVVSPYLTEVSERVSFPGAEHDADPEFAVSGDAELMRVERPFRVTWAITLRLRRTFACGEIATYSVAIRAPSRRLVHPMSVMLPERECRTFSTEVNFGTPPVAARVWRLDGVPAPVAELEDTVGGLPLDPVANPVLRASYRNMVRGRVYGLRWQWAEGDHGYA
jgi:hypothetical protein